MVEDTLVTIISTDSTAVSTEATHSSAAPLDVTHSSPASLQIEINAGMYNFSNSLNTQCFINNDIHLLQDTAQSWRFCHMYTQIISS